MGSTPTTTTLTMQLNFMVRLKTSVTSSLKRDGSLNILSQWLSVSMSLFTPECIMSNCKSEMPESQALRGLSDGIRVFFSSVFVVSRSIKCCHL